MAETRRESDSLGDIEVPADRYYGAQTARARLNFITDDRMPREMIQALGFIKQAAARVNRELGLLPPLLADLIFGAAEEVIAGRLDDHFPLSVWQSGSGTQTNMNVNEVIANRAIEIAGGTLGSKTPVHPNDHVNLSQSTNDAFPAAMHIAVAMALNDRLFPVLARLQNAIEAKAAEFADVFKVARTHLQDAVAMTVGQEMSGWASLIERNLARLRAALSGLYELALGGTAVGTGLNAHPEFGSRAALAIAEITGLPFVTHPNKFAALSAHDELAFVSAGLRTLAGSLMKIANDIRWLASGPRCGLGELILPANEPGSSIMPGKVNPTQCEAVTMVAVQVFGNDSAVAFACSQGNLELNAFKPVIIRNVLHSIRILAGVCDGFVDHCIAGIQVNSKRIADYVERSLMMVTALVPRIGYDRAAKLAKLAADEDISLREANRRMGVLPEAEFEELMQGCLAATPQGSRLNVMP